MTVVSPSLTSRVVTARCVLIGGIAAGPARAAEVGRRVLEGDAHDDRARRGDLRRHPQGQRRVLEGDGDRVVRDGLQRNLDALRHLRLDVVQRGDARRRQDPAVARLLERAQRDVEVEGAVDRSERQADAAGRCATGRLTAVGVPCGPCAGRPTRPSRCRCSGTPGSSCCRARRPRGR